MAKLAPHRVTGFSKRILSDNKEPVEVMPQGDARMDVLANAVVQYQHKEDFIREIHGLWQRAQTTFLTIGKYLALAKTKLPHGEYEGMIERDLPFSPVTARQIRAAAEAVSSGRLVASELPHNYTTLYHLSTLPDEALKQAKRNGLLRPDVRRSEIVAFKKKMLADGQSQMLVPKSKDARLIELRRQMKEIESRRAHVAAEIARLEAEAD